ncbi:hypothetical protein J2T57_002508 [Natronocella acetinitrilica]|uniref:CPXCG motif-containing cysteine-rich protein n=1 Tax=Natronocella acetinitrilica TaxID=414046 RepID=A0AAE3G3Y2_9GAMM|nr:CPXCG motif-containing cysteine-rich protein [Natronocella acetinitrilica]MCP1675360.1 hypothetical protein [Natronocella acetinitrilica]
MITEWTVECPYCWEHFSTVVDYSAGEQEYVEDCQVCCRPIVLTLRVGMDGELTNVDVYPEQD